MEQIIINRDELAKKSIDIGGRDLVVGFSEPAFRNEDAFVYDAPLNARLISYFLPAVQIARVQDAGRRPQLFVVSGINAAVKWNAENEHQRKVMKMNNDLKKDFIATALHKFFPNVFSLIDIRDAIDFLKIPQDVFRMLWELFRERHPNQIKRIEQSLINFRPGVINTEAVFGYAIAHLFALGDINFDWDTWNPKGFCSVGEHHEAVFNEIRDIGFNMLKESGEKIFEKPVVFFDNMKIVIDSSEKLPPPYNGAHREVKGRDDLDEVTYENSRDLDYYDTRPRHKTTMDYVYSLIPRSEYEAFWNDYKTRYEDLKARHMEAFEIAV